MAIHTENTAISALTLAGTAAVGSIAPGIAAAQDANGIFDNATLTFDLGYAASDFSQTGFPDGEDKFGKDSGIAGNVSLSAPLGATGWDWSVSGAYTKFGDNSWSDSETFDDDPFEILRTLEISNSASLMEIDLDVGRSFEAGQATIRAAGGLRLAHYSQTFDKGITSDKVGFDTEVLYDGDFNVDLEERFEGAGPVVKLSFSAPLNPANGLSISGGLAHSRLTGDTSFSADGWVYFESDGDEPSEIDESGSDSAEWISQSAYLAVSKELANGSTVMGGVRMQSVKDEDWRDDYSIDTTTAFVGMKINF